MTCLGYAKGRALGDRGAVVLGLRAWRGEDALSRGSADGIEADHPAVGARGRVPTKATELKGFTDLA